MNLLDQLLSPAQQWLDTLESREKRIVIGGGIALVIILFYLLIWDPVVSRHDEQQLLNNSQRQLHSWIKNAGAEISSLQSAGSSSATRFKNQSISSLADRSARTTGVKGFISKIEQNKNDVKVILKDADFDLIINWLTDLENKYGITSSQIKIERSKEDGAVNANITLERTS